MLIMSSLPSKCKMSIDYLKHFSIRHANDFSPINGDRCAYSSFTSSNQSDIYDRLYLYHYCMIFMIDSISTTIV